MLSDRDLAHLCAASYDPCAVWDNVWIEIGQNPTQVARKGNVLVFRGSVTRLDWFNDVKAIPVENALVGPVEMGFNDGLAELFPKILNDIGENPIICGHSLGAARALIFGGMLAAAGRRPAKVVGFGSPRPSFGKLTSILKDIPGAVYRNRSDPVTHVPFPVPFRPWQHPYPVTNIDVAPETLDHDPRPWLDFRDILSHVVFGEHHIELYQLGAAA